MFLTSGNINLRKYYIYIYIYLFIYLLLLFRAQHFAEGQFLPTNCWRHVNSSANRHNRSYSQFRGDIQSACSVSSSFWLSRPELPLFKFLMTLSYHRFHTLAEKSSHQESNQSRILQYEPCDITRVTTELGQTYKHIIKILTFLFIVQSAVLGWSD